MLEDLGADLMGFQNAVYRKKESRACRAIAEIK